jgi:hypothetical protein
VTFSLSSPTLSEQSSGVADVTFARRRRVVCFAYNPLIPGCQRFFSFLSSGGFFCPSWAGLAVATLSHLVETSIISPRPDADFQKPQNVG